MKIQASLLLVCTLMLLLVECVEKEKPLKTAEKKVDKKIKKEEGKVSKPASKKPKEVVPKPKPKAAVPPNPGGPSESILTQVVRRGLFQKVDETVTLPSGDVLELRCKGSSVRWRYPTNVEEDEEGRLRIKHFDRHSQLVLVNSTGADTGEYGCGSYLCDSPGCQSGEERTGKTFVFITDPRELFVPTEDYYEVIQLRTNQPSLLPCQVTNPLAKVTLHREFPPEDVPVDGVNISFDVKKGFIIYRPHPSYAGSLFCMAELGGLRHISTKYMLIYVNFPSSAPKATIQASVSSIRAGENFVVTCVVLGEPEISVDFAWEYPGQKIGRPPYVRESTNLVRRGGQLLQESESSLNVDGARAVDEGTYTCRAQNLQGTTTVSTRVSVLPPADATPPRRPARAG
ncbi:platelet-derived growth factor receptor-like protein [Ambystoma mexicanum]|uniref:platelet-derived growth factor receptor-like protein n=1 Tax=Ambystoma mexicanum TaxID=8296 RepID=UPI0037E6FC50